MKIEFIIILILMMTTLNIKSVLCNDLEAFNEERSFWVLDSWKSLNYIDDDNDGLTDFEEEDWDEGIYQIDTELIVSSDNFLVYKDKLTPISVHTISLNVNGSDSIIPILIDTFGEIPDVNNDDKITIVITDIRDENYYGLSNVYVQGFFWPVQSLPQGLAIQEYSHHEEILYIDDVVVSSRNMASIVSHELQHLIQFNKHRDQDLWLDESLSVYSQYICGFISDIDFYGDYYFDHHDISLTYFENNVESYGYGFLFILYLTANYGQDIPDSISDNAEIGMLSVLRSIEDKIGKLYSSAEIINNFSLALVVNDPQNPALNIPQYSQKVSTEGLMIGKKLESSVKAWGFNSYTVEDNSDCIKYSFRGEQLDSENNAASYWMTVLVRNNTYLKIWSHFVDPLSGKAEALWPINMINDGEVYIVINCYSGISSGPNPATPPVNNYELELSHYEGEFLFPGYLHQKDMHVMVTSIRVYDNRQEEWDDGNTEISKYELREVKSGNILKEGELIYLPSGWLVPDVDLTNYDKSGEYNIRFLFYNGEETITFNSQNFRIEDSNDIKLETIFGLILPLGIVVIMIVFVFAVTRYSKRKKLDYDQNKLTKLEPMFYGKDKGTQEEKEVIFRRRKIKR